MLKVISWEVGTIFEIAHLPRILVNHSVLRKAMGLLYIMASIESTGVPGYCAPVINFEVLHGQLRRWLGHR